MRKSMVNVLATCMNFAANAAPAGNVAERLDNEPGGNEPVNVLADKLAEGAAPAKEKELTAQEKWNLALAERVVVKADTGKKLSDAELVEFGTAQAKEFKKLAEGMDKLTTTSANLYHACAEVFPVRNGINGAPNLKEFADRIWGIIPEKLKTPGKKAGTYLPCTSAAKERNMVAIGIQSMIKYCQRNAETLFAHLGAQPIDEDAKALRSLDAAIKKVSESALLPDIRVALCDAEGNPILDDGGAIQVLDVHKLMTMLHKALEPQLNEKQAADKAFREGNKEKLAEADKQRQGGK